MSGRYHRSMMMAALAAVVPLLVAAASAQSPPPFCKGLECPRYTVVKKIGDDIELRRYEPASWVSTKASGTSMDSAMQGTFMKLFNYISGTNDASAKIPMTAPVVTRVDPGDGPFCESTFTISFYNPSKYQPSSSGAPAAKAPKPTDPAVFLSDTPGMEVYVMPYGGFSSADTARAKAAELVEKLKAAGESNFDSKECKQWYTAGYDSPFTITNRHSEVWVPAKPAASGKAAAQQAKPAAAAGKPTGRRLI